MSKTKEVVEEVETVEEVEPVRNLETPTNRQPEPDTPKPMPFAEDVGVVLSYQEAQRFAE